LLVYLEEFHDNASKRWLENYAGFKLRAAQFSESDEYLLGMMREPVETGTITVAHAKGYFQASFPYSIEPQRLAQRILAIREQLAEEWRRYLKLIEEENNELNRIHLELSFNNNGNNDGASTTKLMRARIFDSDPFVNADSALCSANYRKLKTMLTHYAAYAVLEMLHLADNHAFNWLNLYLTTHPVHSDEQFLRALWVTPPVAMTNPVTIVRPQLLAAEILTERVKLSKDWHFLLGTTSKANQILTSAFQQD